MRSKQTKNGYITEFFFTNKSQFAAPLKAKSNMTEVRVGFSQFDEEDEKFKKP